MPTTTSEQTEPCPTQKEVIINRTTGRSITHELKPTQSHATTLLKVALTTLKVAFAT